MDIGPATEKLFREVILSSKTVIWNGGCGAFAFHNFAKGTLALCDACADAT